jgi:hypothetical protein
VVKAIVEKVPETAKRPITNEGTKKQDDNSKKLSVKEKVNNVLNTIGQLNSDKNSNGLIPIKVLGKALKGVVPKEEVVYILKKLNELGKIKVGKNAQGVSYIKINDKSILERRLTSKSAEINRRNSTTDKGTKQQEDKKPGSITAKLPDKPEKKAVANTTKEDTNKASVSKPPSQGGNNKPNATLPPPSNLAELSDIPKESDFKSRKGVAKVGSGAFGTVYVDRSTNPPRALKYGDIMETEYIIGKKLGELGVSPKIYSNLETRGQNSRGRDMQAMSMEFIDGKTVSSLYPKNIPDDAFQNILNVRGKINLAGIAHKDFHDENIIIDNKGKVFALDPYNPTSGDWKEVIQDIVHPAIETTVLKKASKEMKAKYKKASQRIKDTVDAPDFWKEKSREGFKSMVEDFYKEMQK